jgi:hypothetical protein
MLFYCQTCGLVREAEDAPWCRHTDLRLPAARMVDLPNSHPLYGAHSHDPGMQWLADPKVRSEDVSAVLHALRFSQVS